ncbi:MAG TPA: sugar-binding protein [Bacillales bacterium]|nr:sugar-binding protein [Bacillales bacterium]
MKIRRLIYPALLALLILSFVLTVYFMVKALQFDPELSNAAGFDRPRYHFILIPEEMDNPYWRLVGNGAKEAAAKYDAVVEYNGPVQTDMEKHIRVMKMAIASKVDGIITQGLNKEITPVINRAIQQGIPVVTVDTDALDSRRIAYVGTDNYQAGKMAGRFLIHKMNGEVKVGIITGSFRSKSQKQRVQGFRDAVKADQDIEIVAVKASHISRVQAAEQTYEIFKNHPDVTVFFGTSALDGLGISATVQRLGKTDDVYILAFDKLPATLRLIEKGKIEATVAQRPYQMGYQSVKMMVAIVKGENVPKINATSTRVIQAKDLPLSEPSSNQVKVAP